MTKEQKHPRVLRGAAGGRGSWCLLDGHGGFGEREGWRHRSPDEDVKYLSLSAFGPQFSPAITALDVIWHFTCLLAILSSQFFHIPLFPSERAQPLSHDAGVQALDRSQVKTSPG